MICDAKKICALISRAQKIEILCHANPDGDTLGSALALFRTLRALCKDVSIFCSDVPAGKLTALNGAELVRTDVPKEAFDLAVAVDCSDINLLFRHANLIRHARTSVCVDHHVSNNDYADFTYVERGVAAAAQPIYKLIRLLLPGQELDMQTAELLYTALVTDSGGFAFSSVTGETMRIAANLLDAGVRGTLTGVKESDLNLSFVRILQEKFEAAGFEAVLTRKTEAGLYGTTAPGHKKRDMAARAAIVKEASPALVLSVHQNFFSDSARRGAQAFYLLGSASSKALACSLQSALNRMPECVKKTSPLAGDYFILKCSGAPSAIVECGFLSSPADEQLLVTEGYREKLASAVFEGALTYLSSAS